jgi:NADH-quinone oxidoreductase subunit J
MDTEAIELGLLILAVIFAIIAVEQAKLIRSVMGLLGLTAVLGAIFFILGAYQVAIMQLLVYAGGVIALFLFVILLTRGVED